MKKKLCDYIEPTLLAWAVALTAGGVYVFLKILSLIFFGD